MNLNSFSFLEKKMEKKKIKNTQKTPIKQAIITKKPSRIKFMAALALLAIGLALLPTSLLLSNTVQNEIDKGVAEEVQVPHPHNSEFDEWKDNDHEDAPKMYSTYYLWNLTNPIAFLAGEKPIYKEVGPFKFREYKYKYDIEFNDDKSEVEYKEYSRFVQVGGDNVSLVNITNINPGFLGSVATAGGTDLHYNKLNFPFVLSQVKEEFSEIYNNTVNEKLLDDNFIRASLEDMLKDCTAYILGIPIDVTQAFIDCVGMDAIKEFMRDGLPSPEEVFFEEWANDYFPDFHGDYSILDEAASGVNALLMKQIINDEDCQTAQDTIITMQNAKLVDEAGSLHGLGVDIDGRYGYLEGSESDLNISTAHAEEIDHFVHTYSIIVAWSTMNLPIYERAGGSGLNYSQCLSLWNKSNPNSLTGLDYEANKIWFDAAEGCNESKNFLKTEFEINITQLDYILKWINESIITWVPNAIEYTINGWNSGVITTRTAEEWLFCANDTAIFNYMSYYTKDLNRAKVNIFDNCRDEIEAEQVETKSQVIKTGRDDISELGQYIEYDNEKEIYLWDEPEEIEGTNGMQFSPGVSKDNELKTFQPDLMRVVELEYKRDSEIHDIDLLRFKMASETFDANPNYYMDTQGLINLQPVEQYEGVEVRVSKPHFLDADYSVQSAVIGMSPDSGDHNTYIDVEPITGIAMKAEKRIQVNFEISSTEYFLSNISEVIVPITWYEQSGEIPEELAEEFKDLVYGALDLKEDIFMWTLGIGACLAAPGLGLSTSQIHKKRTYKKERLAIADKIKKKKMKSNQQNSGLKVQGSIEKSVD
ncbi:MAG: hypothetical protein EU539_07810 [Promethearchaeota archaeon]|nr:MAG: hypothetical protein EU539_07810 [Candidatus Lokiarchaeota archaeon]